MVCDTLVSLKSRVSGAFRVEL